MRPHLHLLVLLAAGLCLHGGAEVGARAYETDSGAAASERPTPMFEPPSALLRAKPARRTLVADADGDGTVSREEAVAYFRAIFRLLDRDDDGALVRSDFEALRPRPGDPPKAQRERLTRLFATLDRNRDRKLEEHEFMGVCERHYAISDADGDGDVSASEFRARPAF